MIKKFKEYIIESNKEENLSSIISLQELDDQFLRLKEVFDCHIRFCYTDKMYSKLKNFTLARIGNDYTNNIDNLSFQSDKLIKMYGIFVTFKKSKKIDILEELYRIKSNLILLNPVNINISELATNNKDECYYRMLIVSKSEEFKYVINESFKEDIKLSEKYKDIKEELVDKIEKSLATKDINSFKNFIKLFIKNPDESNIEGLINVSDVYEFYLKYRQGIDEVLYDVDFYSKIPSELEVFSLYDYIIKGTKLSIAEFMKEIEKDLNS